jgi:hypothetical protein
MGVADVKKVNKMKFLKTKIIQGKLKVNVS